MKINRIFVALILPLLFASNSSVAYQYVDVTNPGNWNWSSTIPNQPWPSGTLPTTNSLVEVEANVVITNDLTNAVCMALDSSVNGVNGTVVMAPGSTLIVGGALEGYGTEQLGALIATATNSTVIYQGNAYWAKRTDYWNILLSGWGNFYTGSIPVDLVPPPITIHGNFTVNGTNVPPDQTNNFTGVNVQCGTNLTVLGNLFVGASNFFDC
jgi:hypothetical protein